MARDLISKEEEKYIVEAIKEAETHTSGEIQVHFESHCKVDVLDRAANIFAVLKMHKTKLRSGVLFYMAIKDHKFAILGDAGINQNVPEDFWDNIKEEMLVFFKEGNIAAGICKGIKMAGLKLREHFPKGEDNENELPDEVSFGE